ncbi:hypothetical protein SELMODRAFT_415462 [Selaginella moellendorffii]|uniref:DDE Tnp4 domain-containing protein n=1 Tax=Selaginella moellendorffii TaxID=88036 RepID=D8RW69_SELML|nr:hypothetical protein SELMODRAFT_415462 [Selaginella moellendorffii]
MEFHQDKFGIGKSTAHEIVMDTTVAIVKCLRRFELLLLVTGTRLPSVAGAIDCTPRSSDLLDWTVRATTTGSSGTLSSCKGFVMPRRVLSVYAGWPGRVHDMRVFRNSTLRNKIVARELLTSPVYLPNIIKSCCILHNFLIDVGETDLRGEIQAWRKDVKRLKDQDLFVDYSDPEQAEGEPREELHSPEDAKECSNAFLLSANPRVFFHLNLRHV